MPPPTIRSPSNVPSASVRCPGEGSRRATAISSNDWKVFQGRPSSISARQPISWNRRSWASSWTSIGRVCMRPNLGGRRAARHLVYFGVLHLQLRVPAPLTDQVVGLLCDDDTVTNVAVLAGAYAKPPGSLVTADVAREGANPVVAALRALDLHHVGSIMISEPGTLLSDAADAAEKAAPGIPDDGIVWDVVENRVRTESVLSWAFLLPDPGHPDRRRRAAARPADPDHRRDGRRPGVLPGRRDLPGPGPAAPRDPAAGADHAVRRLRDRDRGLGAVLGGRARPRARLRGRRRPPARRPTSSSSRTSGRSSSRCSPGSRACWR